METSKTILFSCDSRTIELICMITVSYLLLSVSRLFEIRLRSELWKLRLSARTKVTKLLNSMISDRLTTLLTENNVSIE